MKLLIICLIVFFSFFWFSCTTEKNPIYDQISTEIDTIVVSVDHREEFNWNTVIDSVHIVSLESSPQTIIGNISGKSLFNEKLYIIDDIAQRLLVFDRSGKYFCDIGRLGRGPGEYSYIRDISIDPISKHVYILDYGKILEFDSAFKFVKNHPLNIEGYINPLSFIWFSEDLIFCWVNGYIGLDKFNLKGKMNHLHIIRNNDIINSSIEIRYLDTSIKRFIRSKNVYMMPPDFDYTIRKLNESGIEERFFINFEDKSVPLTMIDNSFNVNALRNNNTNLLNYCHSVNMFIETNYYFYFNFEYRRNKYHFFKDKETKQAIIGFENFKFLYKNIPINNIIGYDDHEDFLVAVPLKINENYISSNDNQSLVFIKLSY